MPVANNRKALHNSGMSALIKKVRQLVLVFGDQLSHDNPAFESFCPESDLIVMIESAGEARSVWSHKARIALFLSAMRHFCDELVEKGWPVHYHALTVGSPESLLDILSALIRQYQPVSVCACEPGEYRLEQGLIELCRSLDVPLKLLDDTHFMCSRAEFSKWSSRLKTLRMEFFYRDMRAKHGVLMAENGEPIAGQWNFDADNRKGYPKQGPGDVPKPAQFVPSETTREVFELVETHFPTHPGSLAHFAWPVNRAQALDALQRFIDLRLPNFGPWQDAMWTDHPFGWHSLLATSLNLHLLNPREVIFAVQDAYQKYGLDLGSVEGFVRQMLGWREFVRGVYWTDMPALKANNFYNHQRPLPNWFWSGKTQMRCMQQVVDQTLQYGYAHHIQRLMVTGNFSLLAQLSPQAVSDWYLAVYVDAVEWVELPNVAGMALFANGGRFTSKPYISSGAYIKRMSNYCQGCRYDPTEKTGSNACPVTVLYWNFLIEHEAQFSNNPRTALMVKHVRNMTPDIRAQVQLKAQTIFSALDDV